MLRSAASKVMWVGRATVFFVGLAVIVGLVFGAASRALGADLDNFILGKANNSATKVTGLISNVANAAQSALLVRNSGPGPALDLRVGTQGASPATQSVAPMKVNSQVKVTNLNADELDGKDQSEFATQAELDSEANTRANADSTLSTQLNNHHHDAAYVNEADHTKAAHDALDIDADTVDGKHAADFASKAEASGVDSQTISGFLPLSTTTTDILSITLVTPDFGYVILTGNGIFDSAHTNGTETLARAFLTQNSGSQNSAARTYHAVPSSAPSGLYSDPFSFTRVFAVDPGQHTFYMTADLASGSGSIGHTNLTGVFIKNQF